MLTLITGPDSYLVRTAIERIRAQHDPDGLNTSTIDARSTNLEEIVIALGTPGFFGGKRVIIVNDLMSRSSKQAAADSDDDESAGSAGSVDWSRVFGAIQPGNVAVFADRSVRTVPAAVKKAIPKETEIIDGEPPRGSQLVAWIKERAVAAGSTIADMDARLLAELLCPTTWSTRPTNPAYDRPPDLEQFANEVDKLAMAAYPGPIERTHINEMSAAGQADRLFPLIDAVMAGEGTVAIRELSSAMSGGEEASRVSAQLMQQTELIAALDTAGRMDPVDVGRQLGLSNPNRMAAIARSLRRVRGAPVTLLDASLEADRQLKTGVLRSPNDQLFSLVDRVLSQSRTRRNDGT